MITSSNLRDRDIACARAPGCDGRGKCSMGANGWAVDFLSANAIFMYKLCE
jgi:hypothetical protein